MPRTALPGEAKEGVGWAFLTGSVMLRATQESQPGDADTLAGGARREAFWVNLEARASAESQGRRCEWLSSRVGGRRPGRTSGNAAVMGSMWSWGHPREDVPTSDPPSKHPGRCSRGTQEPGPQTHSQSKEQGARPGTHGGPHGQLQEDTCPICMLCGNDFLRSVSKR